MTTNKETSGNVKVCIRVRPLSNKERSRDDCRSIVRVVDSHMLVFDPLEEESHHVFGRRKITKSTNRASRDLRFAFDHVFNEDASNEEVFENTTKGVVDALLGGYNCSVFAYGATGAGKTHTMLGTPQNPGVMYQTLSHLFDRIGELQNESVCDVAVAYLEVYNEQIRDLLANTGPLPLREDPNGTVLITGLTTYKPIGAHEVLHMLERGNAQRTQHPTDANSESSRSHAVLQVFVQQRPREAGLSTEVRRAKLQLVDLAGSERAQATQNRGARMREGANINRSLLSLGSCINALTDSKNKGRHVPYRNSKLTRILKDSLGGNCHTIMIAAVSPWNGTYEDSLNTLRYADRAKHIRTCVKRNEHSVAFHLAKYSNIVADLKAQISELQSKLEVYEKQELKTINFAPSPATAATQQRLCSELRRVQAESDSAEKELVGCSASLQLLGCRQSKLQRLRQALKAIGYTHPVTESALERVARLEGSTGEKVQNLQAQQETLRARSAELRAQQRVAQENGLQHRQRDGRLPQEMVALLCSGASRQRQALLEQARSHALNVAGGLHAELLHTHRQLQEALELCARQQSALRNLERPYITDPLQQQYAALLQSLAQSRAVTWADQGDGAYADLDLPPHYDLDLSVLAPPAASSAQSPWASARRILTAKHAGDNTSASPVLHSSTIAEERTTVEKIEVPRLEFEEENASHAVTNVKDSDEPVKKSVRVSSSPPRSLGKSRLGVSSSRPPGEATDKSTDGTPAGKAFEVRVSSARRVMPSYTKGTLASRMKSGRAQRVAEPADKPRQTAPSQARRRFSARFTPYATDRSQASQRLQRTEPRPAPTSRLADSQARHPHKGTTPLRRLQSSSALLTATGSQSPSPQSAANETFTVPQATKQETITKTSARAECKEAGDLLNVTVTKAASSQHSLPVVKPLAARTLFDSTNTPPTRAPLSKKMSKSVSTSTLPPSGKENSFPRPTRFPLSQKNADYSGKGKQKAPSLASIRAKLSVLMKGNQATSIAQSHSDKNSRRRSSLPRRVSAAAAI